MNNFANVEDDELIIFHQRVAFNVKRLRKKRGLSQLDVALTIGLNSVTFFTNAENCKNNKRFNLEHLYKIAKALDVHICELLN